MSLVGGKVSSGQMKGKSALGRKRKHLLPSEAQAARSRRGQALGRPSRLLLRPLLTQASCSRGRLQGNQDSWERRVPPCTLGTLDADPTVVIGPLGSLAGVAPS